MGECPINPVAPALANALEDATGVRFREMPFTPDRIFEPIFERHGAAPVQPEPVGVA
jgi:CO/xanthine dehydrogenase Mo-binding subunit